MTIVVLGAGVVGVTTAYKLLRDGHDVTVIDRAEGPALFASYANAGLVAPGHAYAWASPLAPGLMLRSLWRRDQAIRFRPAVSLRQWTWLAAFLKQCNAESARRNTEIKARLCRYSQQQLAIVTAETGVAYDGRKGGLIYFYRSPQAFAAAAEKCEILRRQGITVETLQPHEIAERDPGLAPAAGQIAGALFAPTDESGDAHLFTRALAEHCAELGATFHYGVEVKAFAHNSDRVSGVETSAGPISGDQFVLCCGVHSAALAAPLGLRLPIYPVKGYSVTLPITDAQRAPQLGGVDEENLLAYCPMGERLRLTATAEIAGYSTAHKPGDFRAMLNRAQALFGACVDYTRPEYWAGLRPMTPSGIPIVDRSPLENLWLNTGHGHMGWTMANGCAQILTDLIGQRAPQHATEGLRYEHV
ncbi:MAG: D-amino acid dehydrogenase [Gammaproteobacteria bacterium]|nr:D-amino acid dehydrogenase [Gammaproteobacteria bacterium]